MSNIDLFEIASYCQKRHKETLTEHENVTFVQTQFFGIAEDGQITCSNTPHLLRDARQCILVHERKQLAFSNWYSWFKVEFIDADGSVHDNCFDNDFSLDVNWKGKWSRQVMKLKHKDEIIYSCDLPWEDHIPLIWEMYNRVKQAETLSERKLIAELLKKDHTLLQLEKELVDFKFSNQLLEQERDQYKELLDEIKQLIAPKQ